MQESAKKNASVVGIKEFIDALHCDVMWTEGMGRDG